MSEKLEKLVDLSTELADPFLNLAIIGEGNTSADAEDGTFWVKASGSQLATIDASGFSRVNGKAVIDLLDQGDLDDEAVAEGLKEVLMDPSMRKPSVETFLHALCIYECGAKWVGHTHPVSVMSILCSTLGAQPFKQHIFPDAIVVCGEMPAVVPYVDPGLPLALAVREELRRYRELFLSSPKLVLMENHGMVALGQSPTDVLNISKMADKWARTLIGAYSISEPRFLTKEQAKRIENRPDEHYRRKQIVSK